MATGARPPRLPVYESENNPKAAGKEVTTGRVERAREREVRDPLRRAENETDPQENAGERAGERGND